MGEKVKKGEQEEKSCAKVASRSSKGKTLDDNVLVAEVAKKVNREIIKIKKAIEKG